MAAVAALAAIASYATGCATAQPNPRRGLLESVDAIHDLPEQSHRSNRFAAVDRSPAARMAEANERGFSGASPAAQSDPAPRRHGLVGTLPGQSPPSHIRPAVEIAEGSLRWPVANAQVTSPFGQRGHEFHEGIDLRAPVGTPVLAAQDGTVIYAGSKIRGYGRLVVIRHFKQVSTIYAHNSRLLVRAGQYVRQGQKIAISGRSGHVTGPHVHFEVRDGLSALNPLRLLPSIHAQSPMPVSSGPDEPIHVHGRRPTRPAVATIGRRVSRRRHSHHRRRGTVNATERVVATAPMPQPEAQEE
jgi:murein DD-endopeptidase MepM/ murein hydrolase activator NlpD